MDWCAKQAGAAARLAAVLSVVGCLAVSGKSDPEVDRWFDRHPDALWKPLVERWAPVKASMKSPVENLMLPIDHFPNGRIKAVLRARKAQLFMDGIIFAEDVTVDLLTEDGALDGRLTAEGCIFDRNVRHGYCEGRVTMVKGADRLKGRGMYFSFEGQFIKILAECEIRTHRVKNNFGRF